MPEPDTPISITSKGATVHGVGDCTHTDLFWLTVHYFTSILCNNVRATANDYTEIENFFRTVLKVVGKSIPHLHTIAAHSTSAITTLKSLLSTHSAEVVNQIWRPKANVYISMLLKLIKECNPPLTPPGILPYSHPTSRNV